jgi:hypothetical protein
MAIQEAMARLIAAERALAPLEAREQELSDKLREVRGAIEIAFSERAKAQLALSSEVRAAAGGGLKANAGEEPAAPSTGASTSAPDSKRGRRAVRLAKAVPNAVRSLQAPAGPPPTDSLAQLEHVPF